MIQDIVNFIRQEKKFTVLCLIVAALYCGVKYYAQPAEAPKEPLGQEAVTGAAAEEKASKPADAKAELEALQKRLKEDPKAARLLAAVGICILGVFSLGIFVLFGFLFNPRWRQSWDHGIYDVDTTAWKPSMLVKLIVYFIGASFAVNLTLILIQMALLPQLSNNFILLLQTTIVDILCLYFIIRIVRDAGGAAKDVGFKVPPRGPLNEIVIGIIGYLGVFPVFVFVLLILAVLAQIFSYQPPAHPLVNIFLEEDQKNPWLIVYSIVLATIIAPFLEEVFFRGFCYKLFKHRMGARAAMIVSSAFFAAIHENAFAFLPIFILGMALSYVYEKRGSLIAPVTLHLFHNSTFILYFFLVQKAVGKG